MNQDPSDQEESLEDKLASELRARGYEVQVEPEFDQLPFSLGDYRPDILARRNTGGIIVEIRASERGLSLDRFAEIAETVRIHEGWRFVLVPADRAADVKIGSLLDIPDWGDIAAQMQSAIHLMEGGQLAAAFMISWSALESILRRVGEERDVPASGMTHVALIKHMYSFGILGMEDFRELQALVPVRNAVVHGFSAQNIEAATRSLLGVISSIVKRWSPTRALLPS